LAVLGRLLVGSGERLDLADLLSLDSYVAADFKYLIQSFIGANKPYILYGLDVISPQDAIGTENISIRIAESVVYYPGSQAGSFYYGLEEGNINAQPLIPELRKNATNFVYLTFSTFDTAKDSRAFWDPDQNGGAGGEFSQDVNTETALKVEVNVSVSTFPENTIPICKVVVGASVISSIQDCRDHFFRLGTGGVSPDPFSTYDFREDPSAPYARLEPPTTMTSALNPNPFQGGDKNIRTLKEWMDVVMTRIKELGGTAYWYQGSAVPGAGPNVSNVFLDALGSTVKSKGEWQHSGVTPGQATWTEDIHYYSLVDSRDLIVRANTITLASSDKVAWINLEREADFNGIAATVDWQNGINYLNGASGAFINLSKGDWVKKTADANLLFLRVEEFYALPALAGGTTTPALAQSVRLSGNYLGTTGTEVGQYTKGEYLLTDINITNRDDAAIAAAGGNFFWLAYRSDTTLGLALASSITLSLDITDADGITAKCTHVGHGLVDKDRITIVGGAYAGTYVIEYESADVFYISAAVTGDDLGRAAYYGLVTTAARSTAYGYALETANHGFKSGETIVIAGASPWNGQYVVNYRNPTQVQIPIGSALATTGPVAGEIVSLPRLNVRTEFGTVKVVAGESTNIGDMDSENLMSFIGMDSLAQTYPNYSIPNNYNALNGHHNYNSLSTDSLTTRVSRLTAMMADRVQDRGMQIVGRTNIRSVTSGANQEVSALADLTLKKPGSTDLTITMTSAISIPANSIAVIDIDRDGSGSIVPTVESWGSNYVISENKIILFYRFADTNIYTWDGSRIAPSGHLNLHHPDDSQNRNVYAFNPGQVKLNTGTGLLELAVDQAAEISRVTAKSEALTPQSSYFTMHSANNAESYYVWYNKAGGGIDPILTYPVQLAGYTGIMVALAGGESDITVAAATIAAINGAASVEVTASNYNPTTILLTNDSVGPAVNTADGLTATTYTIASVQAGFDPDIEIVIPGAASNNIVDVDAINTLGTLILADGQCAWVRINRFALKTFNIISLTDVPDTDGAGAIYITTMANVPIDQDVFVLWTRIDDNIAETNKAQHPDGNVYDETYDVISGIPSNSYEIQGPIVAGTEIQLPPDSRDTISGVQEYIVGSGQLEVFLRGQYLLVGRDWFEVGTTGALSKRITLAQDLVVTDFLTFRIDAKGAVYFASDGSGGGDLQDAYDAGRFIAINSGQPIVITGPASQKLISIQGDMEVTGLIDPLGITFIPTAANPLNTYTPSAKGLWVRSADNDMQYEGAAFRAASFKVGAGAVELTQTILTNLIALQNGTDFAVGTNSHVHDGRYYTEAELNAGQLNNLYYTEAELNAGQLDTRYYTETELNAGQLDTRYYTETELNAGQLDTRYFTETELQDFSVLTSGSRLIGDDATSYLNIAPATSQAEVTDVTITQNGAALDGAVGLYWLLNSANNTTQYYVWYNVTDGTPPSDPAPVGKTPIMVNVLLADSATTVATKTAAVLLAHPDFNAVSVGPTVTVTNAAPGATTDATAGTTASSINVVIQGTTISGSGSIRNTLLAIDASLGSFSKLYIQRTNNSGVTISAGDIVVASTTTANEILKADASALLTSEGILGVATGAIPHGSTGQVQIAGLININQSGAFTLGKSVYVSASVPGEGTSTAPSALNSVVFSIGVAVSTTQVLLQPNLRYVNE
jgi:Uncharacterized conserved protein (DUF2190)